MTTTNPRIKDYYKGWTREQLVERLLLLEGPPKSTNSLPLPSPKTKYDDETSHPVPTKKEFNFEKYAKRKIALKFCYSGWEYCGLAYQVSGMTDVPTVEGVLFEALGKAKLIDCETGMEGCGWEKCGRTDRGVSAAGQVVSLWVRSAVGQVEKEVKKEEEVDVKIKAGDEDMVVLEGLPGLDEEDFGTLDISESPESPTTQTEESIPRHELDYIAILNRLLPPTIRILAWAPVASSFSARFSCKYRHYKYFFSSYNLDIPRMREGASRLIGEHDFRNMCKVDAQKQITMFRRIISRADIESVGGEEEGMYVFNLVGSAFLYHQVRHIMAILFLVGTGLEKPSLVTKLMNVVEGAERQWEGDDDMALVEVIDRKPEYQMADALPLMLWDCGYAEEDVKWRTTTAEPSGVQSDDGVVRRNGFGTETDLYHQLHSIWTRSRIYTVLDKHFLHAAEKYHAPPSSSLPLVNPNVDEASGRFNYPLGGGIYKRVVKYVPVLERNRLDTVDAINERWRLGKGMRRAERKSREDDDDDEGNEE